MSAWPCRLSSSLHSRLISSQLSSLPMAAFRKPAKWMQSLFCALQCDHTQACWILSQWQIKAIRFSQISREQQEYLWEILSTQTTPASQLLGVMLLPKHSSFLALFNTQQLFTTDIRINSIHYSPLPISTLRHQIPNIIGNIFRPQPIQWPVRSHGTIQTQQTIRLTYHLWSLYPKIRQKSSWAEQ